MESDGGRSPACRPPTRSPGTAPRAARPAEAPLLATALHVHRAERQASGRPTFGTAACSLSDADGATSIVEACRPPTDVGVPITQWSAHFLADYLQSAGWNVSESSVRRMLRGADLQPHRQKMWLTSHHDELRARRDDVLHVYYDTPPGEHIWRCREERRSASARRTTTARPSSTCSRSSTSAARTVAVTSSWTTSRLTTPTRYSIGSTRTHGGRRTSRPSTAHRPAPRGPSTPARRSLSAMARHGGVSGTGSATMTSKPPASRSCSAAKSCLP